MAETLQPSLSLPAWVEVLDKIEEGLRQSLEKAIEPAELSNFSEQAEIPDLSPLLTLDDRLAKGQALLDGIAAQTEDAGTLAAREETELAALVQSMKEARGKAGKMDEAGDLTK